MEVSIIVVNKYHKPHPEGYVVIYCGRPSKYGNPFKVGGKYARGEAVEAYREYAERENLQYPEIVSLLKSGKSVALECFCKPKACHCDVIKERAWDQFIQEC